MTIIESTSRLPECTINPHEGHCIRLTEYFIVYDNNEYYLVETDFINTGFNGKP